MSQSGDPWLDLAKGGLGAVIGFVLAQTVNLARLWYQHLRRPVLRIEQPKENYELMTIGVEDAGGRFLYSKIVYGFQVRNTGRTIATGVRFQINSVEMRLPSRLDYERLANYSIDLAVFENAEKAGTVKETSILPGAAAQVALAVGSTFLGLVEPHAENTPGFFGKMEGAEELRFLVAAFDRSGEYTSAQLTIRCPKPD